MVPIRIEKPSGVEEEMDDAELEATFGYHSSCCFVCACTRVEFARCFGVFEEGHPSHVLGNVGVQIMSDAFVLLRSPSPFLRNR